jgi:uroporphyrinogen decarboxylase
MKHRERAKIVLDGGIPDYIPTFELIFYETRRDFQNRDWIGGVKEPNVNGMSYTDKVKYNAQLYIDVAKKYEHSLIFVNRGLGKHENDPATGVVDMIKEIREISGDEYMVMCHNDPTFMIPFKNVEEFCFRLFEEPEKMHETAKRNVENSKKDCNKFLKAGADGFIMCCDYCFNNGPFISPDDFGEFIAPYLKESVAYFRKQGAYVIKHTDGNIMPIIDYLLDAKPHALHSLDPMAGVDIKEVKDKYGDQVALCGNVDCSLMEIGTKQQIIDSAEYCLKNAKKDGGYFFATSNGVYRGMPLESYDLIQKIWKEHRNY